MFEIFRKAASSAANGPELDWVSIFLFFAGPKVQQVRASLEMKKEQPTDEVRPGPLATGFVVHEDPYDSMVKSLTDFFAPKRNKTFERHIFRNMKQAENETIDLFVMRHRQQAERCEYDDGIDDFIKDQITEGCWSAELRKKILQRKDGTLDDVLMVARIDEAVREENKVFANAATTPIAATSSIAVNKIESRRARPFPTGPNRPFCSRCGYKGHRAADPKCPAKGKRCNKCGKNDHFARKCLSVPGNAVKEENDPPKQFKPKEVVQNVTECQIESGPRSEIDYDDCFCVMSPGTASYASDIECTIGGIVTKAIIDSGCKCNLIGEEIWTWLKSMNIVATNKQRGSDRKFVGYGGHELQVAGSFESVIKTGEMSTVAKFYVMRGEGKFLIGRETAQNLGILKIGTDVNAVSVKEEELSKMKGIVIDIPINRDFKPVAQPYRRVPAPLERLVNEKIDALCQQGIIEKVNEPSKWVSPLVVVPRNDDIRICVDMRRANEAVQRENHPLPTFEDFLPHLNQAEIYSKIDIKSAFHQVN